MEDGRWVMSGEEACEIEDPLYNIEIKRNLVDRRERQVK